tara:strand:+ start:3825 stop:4532 length:708 start_codon:yes stop_codon:yes gene_type:complete
MMVAGLECFDANLLPHLGIFALGVAMLTPLGESLTPPALRSKWKSLETKLGRIFAGMFLISFSGFTVSAHTLWMHNKSQEMGGGSFCTAGTVCDCASVIGNNDWNTMPFLGLPWGLLGMLAFALFMWLIISMAKDPAASWVLNHLKIGTNFAILGLGIILYLMYAEYKIGKICQFCTTAHIAHVAATFGFITLSKMYGTSDWAVGNSSVGTIDPSARERRKRGGYVAPKQASEEE